MSCPRDGRPACSLLPVTADVAAGSVLRPALLRTRVRTSWEREPGSRTAGLEGRVCLFATLTPACSPHSSCLPVWGVESTQGHLLASFLCSSRISGASGCFYPCASGSDFHFWKLLLPVLCTVCFPPGERPGGLGKGLGWGRLETPHRDTGGLRSEQGIRVAESSGATGDTWCWKEVQARPLCPGLHYSAFRHSSEWGTCPLLGPVKNPNEEADVRLFAGLRVTRETLTRPPKPSFLKRYGNRGKGGSEPPQLRTYYVLAASYTLNSQG